MKRITSFFIIVFLSVLLFSCGEGNKNQSAKEITDYGTSNAPEKESEIREYNLKIKEQQTTHRTPCDTIALLRYVLNNYPAGSFIVDFDQTTTFNVPRPAILYYRSDVQYIFAIIAKSKPGERLIEPKNIVGYDQSFIDLDSTKLGTAFFYLTLFECNDNNISVVWDTPIPSHGGFNTFSMQHWNYNGTPYIKVDFFYARGIGHIDYNYFLINGIRQKPHLLMTYKGIDFQRTLANVNNDKFPDYYEYLYYDVGTRVYAKDSIAFIWNTKKNLYVNTRNSRQTRPY